MKKFIILFCGLLLPAVTIWAKKLEGSNNYVNTSVRTDDFYKVKTNGAFNIVYHQDKDSAGLVKMYGEDNILNDMKIESKEGVLNIKFQTSSKKDFGVVILHIYSSALDEVECDAGAVFETTGPVSGSTLSLLLMGNGQIKSYNLDYGIVKAKILSGSGDIFLGGSCRIAELSITGRGEIQAHELKARDVKCQMTGNASLGCYAESKLDVYITGRGRVYYKGEPQITKKIVGPGKILSLKGVEIE